MSAPRCPNCGGLVAPDAKWCGQCLRPLGAEAARRGGDAPAAASRRGAEASRSAAPSGDGAGLSGPGAPVGEAGAGAAGTEPAGSEGGAIRAEGESVVWACPTCGGENPLEATACAACGTPFRKLLDDAPPPPTSSPGRLMGLSLLFPGAGHIAGGRAAEGLARAVVFAFSAGTAVAVLVAQGGLGLGPFVPLAAALALAAAALYGVTAVDAGRLAEGRGQLLSTRVLLYAATGLMLLMVAALVISALRATGA